MKKFLIFNYRGIFHLISMLEVVLFSWILGFPEVYDLNPEHTPVKLVALVINYFVAEWSLKKSGLVELFENEKKNYEK